MADNLKAALEAKLASYEGAGMADHAKRVKARIAQLEKRPAPLEKNPVTFGGVETLSKATAPKKAAKTAKKSAKK